MSMTDEELAALQKLADGATPGPWTAETWLNSSSKNRPTVGPHVLFVRDEYADAYVIGCGNGNGVSMPQDDANCAFIAACREAVPPLLAEVRELRMVVHDMLEDGYAQSKATRYRRALEEMVGYDPTMFNIGPARGMIVMMQELARKALREDENG